MTKEAQEAVGTTVMDNSELEGHQHPLPVPEDLMRRCGGGNGFPKGLG